LIGIAFHPNFANNGYVYVDYTDANGHIVIQRWTARADRRTVDPNSGVVILTIPHPGFQHNGGHITFGPDGYLYIGVGDGGGKSGNLLGGSPGRVMLGAILRIDVNGTANGLGYSIPPDNPFYGLGSWQPEVWDFGLRNPWRFSFDRKTGDLYIGDVGEDTWEEINVQRAGQPGQNFGWPVMEGSECYDDSPCDGSGLALPIAEHDHTHGCSVVGGTVYRGKAHLDLTGIYFYGDFCTGDIYGLANTGGAWVSTRLLGTDIGVTAFFEDADGELYVTDYLKGRVLRLTGFRP
jgi:glucose/arabinose dehydrogenase